MDFRTIITPQAGLTGLVRHGEPILLVGSCFSDNIGTCLRDELFEVNVNPFGPLYNPLSIRRAFEVLATRHSVGLGELFESAERWNSFLFHSRYSGVTPDEAADRMNSQINAAAECLKNASMVIITLGTTRTFVNREDGETVANCHKLPGNRFDVKRLSLDEVTTALSETVEIIRSVNSKASIVFTVSPLRYTEQGAHGNQIAKSTLMLAVDSIVNSKASNDVGDNNITYFPAFEVMIDDLRDYRFYAEDMKHPTPQAVNYIYELFKDTYCDDLTKELATECKALTRRLSHRTMTTAPDAITNELTHKSKLADDFINRHPKLQFACSSYLNSI